jgi:hypothetical protein
VQGVKGDSGLVVAPFTVAGNNVGIDNPTPQAALDVTGSIVASGSIAYGTNGTRTETRDNAGTAGGRSGFFETSAPVNFYPNATSSQHLIEARSSGADNNALQIAGSFSDGDLWYRKTNKSETSPWLQVVAAGPRTCTAPFDGPGATTTVGIPNAQATPPGSASVTRSNTICGTLRLGRVTFNEAQAICFAAGGHIATANDLYRLAVAAGAANVANILVPGDWIGANSNTLDLTVPTTPALAANAALIIATSDIKAFEAIAPKAEAHPFRCVQSSSYIP